MPVYRFCVVLRRPDRLLDPSVREEIIPARTVDDAVEAAQRIHADLIGTESDSTYLVDPNGYVIWSLRLSGPQATLSPA